MKSSGNIVELLATLVGMPTITEDLIANDQALDYVETFLARRGMPSQRFRFGGHSALVASSRPHTAKTPAVMLAAHIDVMTGSENVFRLREDGGKLYGRGTYDMKFAIAAYLQLVDELQNNLADYDFGILITSDEEASKGYNKSGVAHLVNAGYRPRVVLLPDATAPGWEIEEIAKGWWRFDLIAKGKAAHGSRPWEGESASIKLIHALHALKEHFKDHGPLTDSLNIGSIHGEGVYNLVPEQMAAKVEIRLSGQDSSAKNKRLVEALCAEHALTYDTYSLVEPVRPILADPLIYGYMDAVERITGKRPQGYISLGGSDAPYFTNAGIPCALSCPRGGGHHSEDEWLDKKSFLQFVPILRDFLDHVARKQPAPVDRHVALV